MSAIGSLIWIVSAGGLYLVRFRVVTSLLLILLMAGSFLITKIEYKKQLTGKTVRRTIGPRFLKLRQGTSVVVCVLLLIWLPTKLYFFLTLAQILAFVFGSVNCFLAMVRVGSLWKKKSRGRFFKRLLYCILAIPMLAFFVIGILASITAVNASPYDLVLRKIHHTHMQYEAEKSNIVMNDGKFLIRNISYESQWPNGYFDLYGKAEDYEDRPLYIYMHGGGWVYGDKEEGDPFSGSKAGLDAMIDRMVEEGYQVLSLDYALAPEYGYPTPIQQLTELAGFLEEKGDRYHINTDQIVMGGHSAGAQMVGQFALIQTSPAYSEEMGIDPVWTEGQVKALYLGCGVMTPADISDTGFWVADHVFYQMPRGYFHCGDVSENQDAKEADVISHMTEAFPPCYITDGNFMTFEEQAHAMDERMTELGIPHEANILDYEITGELVKHVYDLGSSQYAVDNLEEFVAFLKNLVEL